MAKCAKWQYRPIAGEAALDGALATEAFVEMDAWLSRQAAAPIKRVPRRAPRTQFCAIDHHHQYAFGSNRCQHLRRYGTVMCEDPMI
jgi:hypothetical protein